MVPKSIKSFFMYSAGYTYSNLSRLFLRLFVGLMFLVVGLRQIIFQHDIAPNFTGVLGLAPDTSVLIIAIIEVLCAMCIMLGFFMRVAIIPSFAIMAYAELLVFSAEAVTDSMFAFQPGYPMMFMGIFIFLFLSGPGKISIDFIIAVNFDRNRDEDELLENA